MSDTEIERLAAAEYYADPGLVDCYEDIFKLYPLLDGLAFRTNFILVGPSGIAKSLAVASWCAARKYPIVTFDCSEDVRRPQLVGHRIQNSDLHTPFLLGPLTTAFDIANEVGVCVLVLEEINALSQATQKTLNGMCDFRRKIELPEAKRVFRLKPGAKLFVVGTMNEAGVYGGVYELNRDLKSRFRIFRLNYPAPKHEKAAIRKALGAQAGKIEKKFLTQMVALAHETRQEGMEYALSTRDLVQIFEDSIPFGRDAALELALGKFEGVDCDTMRARIQSHFDKPFYEEAENS